MTEVQRRFGRFKVSLPTELTIEGEVHHGVVTNLSVGGIFFSFTEESPSCVDYLTIERTLFVSVKLSKHTIQANARITWRQEMGIGISFDRLKPLDVWSIIHFSRSPNQVFNLDVKSSHIDQELG